MLKPEGCKKGEGEVQMFACSIFVNSEENFSFKKIDVEPEIEAGDIKTITVTIKKTTSSSKTELSGLVEFTFSEVVFSGYCDEKGITNFKEWRFFLKIDFHCVFAS